MGAFNKVLVAIGRLGGLPRRRSLGTETGDSATDSAETAAPSRGDAGAGSSREEDRGAGQECQSFQNGDHPDGRHHSRDASGGRAPARRSP
jgi:hypothetical protein